MKADLGPVAVTLASFYLLYQAFSMALVIMFQVVYSAPDYGVDWRGLAVSVGPMISLTALGLYLLVARHSVSESLFHPRPAEPTAVDDEDLMVIAVTVVGLVFLVLGVQCFAEAITAWIATNVTDPQLRSLPQPSEVWPYRIGAIAELSCGYLLTFRAQQVAAYLRAQRRSGDNAAS